MKMTAADMIAFVGRTMKLETEGCLLVAVRVLDAKEAYGAVRLLVEPVAGEGQRWVEARRVR